MSRNRIRYVFAVVACGVVLSTNPSVTACTTGVISGKATIDGRPLLWKNRDAPNKDNQVVHLTDGKYACTAVVNAGQRGSIWMGVNEAGFCIENSVTSDLSEKGAKGPGNGGFMMRALKTCATVEEFERLLEETNGKRSTNANFGVIDGQGGAAIFETSPSRFLKFDANDPEVAPQGYVVRSNFSYTGQPTIDPTDAEAVAGLYSGGRFLRGCRLVDLALADGGASVGYLLQQNTRDYSDASGNPFTGSVNGDFGPLPDRIDTTHTISRKTTVSAAVFHGVRPGEDPRLTTMWVMLGEPSFTVAVPCWAGTGEVAAELKGDKKSPLCDASRALRDAFYNEQPGADGKPELILDTAALPEIWARTLPTERSHLEVTAAALDTWRADGFSVEQARELHRRLAAETLAELTELAETLVPQPLIATP
ncbi:MAG: peptidase C45 [Planctomycetaceae bacterium]|nr:MAG: peptidase C45 [Planctomycetaceae bacterium]